MDLSDFKDRYFLLLIGLFILAQTAILAQAWNLPPIWDSAIYTAMGKYAFSGGTYGLWELSRPPVIPLILGLMWKLGIPMIGASRILSLLISVVGLGAVYYMVKDLFSQKIGFYTTGIIATAPLLHHFNPNILTGIPASFLIITSLYLLEKKHYLASGGTAGLVFLTRFPAALVAVTGGIYILARNRAEPKKAVKNASIYSLAFLILTAPFFIFNQLQHGSFLAPLHAGAYFPTLNPDIYVYGAYYLIQSLKAQPLLLLLPVGLYAVIRRRESRYALFLLGLVLFYTFFTYYPHKIPRYLLLFLPLMALFTAKGLSFIEQQFNQSQISLPAFLLIFVMLLTSFAIIHNQYNYTMPQEKQQFYSHMGELDGDVASNDPVTTSYGDFFYKALPPLIIEQAYQQYRDSVDYFAINSCAWYCTPAIENCQNRLDTFEQQLQDEHIKQFESTTPNCNYTVYKTR